MVELSKLELCGGGKHASTESTTSCNECNKNKGKPNWSGSRVEYNCDPPFNEIGSGFDPGKAPAGRYPCKSPTSIRDKSALNNKPCRVVCRTKENNKCYKTTWVLRGCTYKGKKENVKKQDTSKEAVPYILEDDWEKDTKFTVIVSKNTSDKLPLGQFRKGGESFGTSTILGDRTWTVAQAEIYNPTKADMFNQDWHVRLKPCKLDDLNISFFSVKVSNILPSSVKKLLDKGIGQELVH